MADAHYDLMVIGAGPAGYAATTIAIVCGMTVSQWHKVITAHPSLGEALKEADLDTRQLSLHTAPRKEKV